MLPKLHLAAGQVHPELYNVIKSIIMTIPLLPRAASSQFTFVSAGVYRDAFLVAHLGDFAETKQKWGGVSSSPSAGVSRAPRARLRRASARGERTKTP